MRIDARIPPFRFYDWIVWHAERCCLVNGVVWADDETHEYGQHDVQNPPYPIIVKKAKRILILPEQKAVIINPVEDMEPQQQQIEDYAYG